MENKHVGDKNSVEDFRIRGMTPCTTFHLFAA